MVRHGRWVRPVKTGLMALGSCCGQFHRGVGFSVDLDADRIFRARLLSRRQGGAGAGGAAGKYFGAMAGERDRRRRGSVKSSLYVARLFAGPVFRLGAVMPIPEEGLGRAINDRLRRAAVHDSS